MPIATAVKFGVAAAACAYCWKVGDSDKASSLAEKIAAMIICGACTGIAGNEVVKQGVGIRNQLKKPPSVNQAQQGNVAQQRNVKPPPKGSLTQRALANRNPGRRAGFVTLISRSDQEERKTFDYSPQKEIKRQQQQREIKDLEYQQYCQDFNLI